MKEEHRGYIMKNTDFIRTFEEGPDVLIPRHMWLDHGGFKAGEIVMVRIYKRNGKNCAFSVRRVRVGAVTA